MKKICICLVLVISIIGGEAFAEVLIICHKNVTETSLSESEITEIFLGKRVQWEDNSKIRPAITKDADLHKQFLKTYLKKSEKQYQNYWNRLVFSGQGTPPQRLDTEAELIQYVAETEGAIGYMNSTTTAENVKILEVQ